MIFAQRYLKFLGTTAHLSGIFLGNKCSSYVHYVILREAISLFVSGIMATIRVSAIYEGATRRIVQTSLGTICVAQFSVYMWLVITTRGSCHDV